MNIARDKFLSVARHLALVTSTAAPALAACSGSSANTATTVPTARASESSAVSESPPPGDVTAGSGPCRCSWDTNGAAAPRVCKKGEVNYDGVACVPGGGNTSYDEGGYYPPPPVPGPLPPPDLSV